MNSDWPLDRSTIFLSGFAPKRLTIIRGAPFIMAVGSGLHILAGKTPPR
jgi:hypothetical protein